MAGPLSRREALLADGASAAQRSEHQRALTLARTALGRRELTVAQARALLARRGIGEVAISAAIAELQRLGLLDDRRYARLFVQDRRQLDGWGSGRIARELDRRGVPRDLAELELADPDGGRDAELQRALQLLRARFPHPRGDPHARRRAFALLARRGFDSELACEALALHMRP
jgi:regulatory protein